MVTYVEASFVLGRVKVLLETAVTTAQTCFLAENLSKEKRVKNVPYK
jgi:hypothetical protein